MTRPGGAGFPAFPVASLPWLPFRMSTSSELASILPPASVPKPLYRRVLALLTDGVCGFAVFAVVIVVLVQVVSRLLGYPVTFSEELTRALFVWMIFIGVAASIRHADAARITVFMASSTPVIRRLALPIYVAGSLLFFGLMIWTGWTMVRQQWMMNEMIATLGWPSWIVGLVMPLSGVLSVLCLLDSLFEHRATLGLSAPAADKSPEAP